MLGGIVYFGVDSLRLEYELLLSGVVQLGQLGPVTMSQ